MTENEQPREEEPARGMRKNLSLWNFFTIGFGAIIGTGWVLLVGDWMVMGGGPIPAMIAFLIATALLVPIGSVFGELTAAIPISGGIVEYVDRSFGPIPSYITGWLLTLSNSIICPWEAIAISALLADRFSKLPLLGWLTSVKLYTILGADVYLWPTLISLAASGLVVYLNFRGAVLAARLSSLLTKALLAGMVLSMGISFLHGSPSNAMPVFSQVSDTASGSTDASSLMEGIVAVLIMTPFFYAGFDTIPQQAEEASEGLNWSKFGKIIPLALIASGGFYTVCIYSFGTILPWHEFVGPSMPALTALEGINFFLYVTILAIATLGTLGPMNAFFGASTRLILAMARKEQLPLQLAQIDEEIGAPRVACVVMATFTLMGPFLGRNILVPLTNVSARAIVVASTVLAYSCLRLRRTEPDLPRPYRVPGGRFAIFCACMAGTISTAVMLLPSSPLGMSGSEWAIVAAWMVFGLLIRRLTTVFQAHQTREEGLSQ
ncbi:APC family permease [Olsenella urininfantis]|uniref:APC family permease n=1 Tax=Olsenella urininfantis TaxID=1871033 RepID=UPI000986B13E|nr:APC family permease [Olsenella urininfantis]